MESEKKLRKFWDETVDWHGRVAKASYMFHQLLVKEIKGEGIFWSIHADGEEVMKRKEDDWGMALHKAEQALGALTFEV